MQSVQNTTDNDPLLEQADTLCKGTHTNVGDYNQILYELPQTKSDLEDSKKENVILKEKFSKLESEQKIIIL